MGSRPGTPTLQATKMPCPRRSRGPTRRRGRVGTRRRSRSTFARSDASRAATTARRSHVNSRLRHYRVNIAFVFHAIELGLTTVRYCKTTHMRADFLTKALPVGAFRANAALVYPDYEYAPL